MMGRVRAHLEALEAAELDDAGAFALFALAAAGDAIRIGVALPPRLSRWLGGLSRQKLTALCALVVEELDQTLVPGADDPLFEPAVAARDRAESVRLGALRVCVGQRWIPYDIDGYRQLREACGRFDAALFAQANHEAIALALGDRTWLDDGPRWYDAAPTPAEEPALDESAAPAVPLSAPPIAIVAAYLTEGHHHRWVENVAQHDEDFALKLEATIEAGFALDEPISLAARSWLRDRS